jgi:hypothetical protein
MCNADITSLLDNGQAHHEVVTRQVHDNPQVKIVS